MDLIRQSEQISDKYLQSNLDMSSSIAKYASDNNLNIDEVKRLVEESNKSCYLKKFASTGEQTFDVADFEKVKSLVKQFNTVEKTASIKFSNTNYDIREEGLQKVASENNVTTEGYDQAINKCKSDYSSLTNKLNCLLKQASIYVSFENTVDFIKTASTDASVPENLRNNISNTLNEAQKVLAISEHLIEKKAGILSSVSGVALKGAGKAVGFVAAKPMKRGLQPLMYEQTFKQGAKKYADKGAASFVSNASGLAEEVSKTAGLGEFLGTAAKAAISEEGLKAIAPWVLLAGAVGVTTAAAKGMGGMASSMMDKRQLNESFDTIMATNKDLKDIPGVRNYFDVIARHSPDIANDPMVAPQLIRQFDTFGGVDLNTVSKLREMQNRMGPQSKGGGSGFDLMGAAGTLHSLSKTYKNDKGSAVPTAFGPGKKLSFN